MPYNTFIYRVQFNGFQYIHYCETMTKFKSGLMEMQFGMKLLKSWHQEEKKQEKVISMSHEMPKQFFTKKTGQDKKMQWKIELKAEGDDAIGNIW